MGLLSVALDGVVVFDMPVNVAIAVAAGDAVVAAAGVAVAVVVVAAAVVAAFAASSLFLPSFLPF